MIVGTTINDNAADSSGGGILFWYGSRGKMARTTIIGNRAAYGGGVYASASAPEISQCAITGNYADTRGGGIYTSFSFRISGIDTSTVRITNSLVSDNRAESDAGISIWSKPDLGVSCLITNCTIAHNLATGALSSGSGISCRDESTVNVLNSIRWRNVAAFGEEQGIGTDASSTCEIAYSDIQDPDLVSTGP